MAAHDLHLTPAEALLSCDLLNCETGLASLQTLQPRVWNLDPPDCTCACARGQPRSGGGGGLQCRQGGQAGLAV